MSSEFVLRTFGALRLEVGAETISKFPTKRSALLLARLATAREGGLGRDELAEMLWPDDFLDVTRLRLRQELRRLRQSIGTFGDYLRADRQWIEIEPGVLDTDAKLFDAAAMAGLTAEEPAERVASLQRAVDLYTGPFLVGFQESWVLSTRRDYEDKIRKVWMELAEALAASGDDEAALRANMSAVRLFPLDTETNTKLISRLAGLGRAVKAKQALLDFDALMVRELGHHAPSSLLGLVKEPVGVADSAVPHPELPKVQVARPLPIFGRAELLHSVAAGIGRQGAIVVLVGPVGVGKTHILQESLWQLTHQLRLHVQFGGVPVDIEDGVYVPDSKLDEEPLREVIREAAGKGWRVLAESRVRLDFEGFTEILVIPLPVPHLSDGVEAILSNPSVRILTSRIAEHGGFAGGEQNAIQLRDLARSLDGMPAALVVFGSRLVVQTPEQVNQTLQDGLHEYAAVLLEPLRMAIYGLPEEAKEALHSLAVLAGASVDLATALATPHDSAEVFRLLERRCLIAIQDDGLRLRYRIPRPLAFAVREMMSTAAQLRLVAKTWQDVGEWAFARSRKLSGPDQEAAFTTIQAELRNLLAGISWATVNDPKLAAYLVVGTWRTVCARGNPVTDAPLLLKAIESGAGELPAILAGEAWVGTATALAIAGLFDDAERAYKAASDIYERDGNTDGMAWAEMNYATMVLRFRDPRTATEMCRHAAELTSNWGVKAIARCFYSFGLAEMGEIDEAIRVGEQVFAERLQSNDVTEEARSYSDLAELYRKIGRTEAARPLLIEGIQRLRKAGIQDMHFEALMSLVNISTDLVEIQENLDEAAGLARKIGSNPMRLAVAIAQSSLASRKGDMPGTIAAFEEVFRLAKAMESSVALESALKTLIVELERQSRFEYANAVRSVLGEDISGPLHSGWKSLLSSDSRATVCVLAVVMAKEALLPGT